MDPRIGPSHLNVWQDGYRGFDGKCLPKDLASLLASAEDAGVDLPLLKAVRSINETLRACEEIPARRGGSRAGGTH